MAAARLGIPAAQVAIGLAEVEWDSIGVATPALETHRDGLADELRRSPYLTRFPAALDASPFPGTRRYREPAAPHGVLPAWWADTGAPLVYVSFGTVLGRMSFAGEVYRAVIDAVAGLDARVLVTTGHGFDPARLRDVPGNVHVEARVDQADVMGEAGLVVCHGGSGTTYGALAAGVPLVVVPVFANQFANAPKWPRPARAYRSTLAGTPRDAGARPAGKTRCESAGPLRRCSPTARTGKPPGRLPLIWRRHLRSGRCWDNCPSIVDTRRDPR